MRSANVSILSCNTEDRANTDGTGQSQARHEDERSKRLNAYHRTSTGTATPPARSPVRSRHARGRGGRRVCGPVAPHTARGRARRVAGRGARACSRRAGPASRERETETAERDRRAGMHVPGRGSVHVAGGSGRACVLLALRRYTLDFSLIALKSITARPPGNGHAKRHGTDRSGGTCGGVHGYRRRSRKEKRGMILSPPCPGRALSAEPRSPQSARSRRKRMCHVGCRKPKT